METTANYNERVSQAINAWIDTTGKNKERTGNKLSQKTGVNNAVISLLKNGRYVNGKTPIPTSDILAVGKYLEVHTEGQLHYNNDNFIRVQAMADRFQKEVLQGFLDSETPGCGKTYSLEIAARRYSKVIYYKTKTTTNTGNLLRGIMSQLGWKPELKKRRVKKARGAGYKEVVKETRMSNAKRMEWLEQHIEYGSLLIIDELETVKSKTDVYGTLKDLIDMAVGRFGLIASGYGLIAYFRDKAEKGRQGYAQTYSRLNGVNMVLEALTEKDMIDIMKENHVPIRADVANWVSDNLEDYRKVTPLLKVLLEICKIEAKKERKEALDILIDNTLEVSPQARKHYAL